MNLTTSVNKALFNSTRYVSFFNKLFVKLVKNDFLSAGEKLKNWSFFLVEDYFAGRWSSMSLSQKISFSVWFVFSIPRAKKKLSFHVKSSTTESLRFLCNYRHNISVPPFGAPHLVQFVLSFLTNLKHFYLQWTLIFDVYLLDEFITLRAIRANKYV